MNDDILAITVCATEAYQYAMRPQASSVAAAIRHLKHPVHIILVGDSLIGRFKKVYKELLPSPNFEVHTVEEKWQSSKENYKHKAQLTIAQMRQYACDKARALGANVCWSLDSDVIPPVNAYKNLRLMLDFDDGYYGVTISPYPTQGGGTLLLMGRGWPSRPIAPDVYDDERAIPEDLQKEILEAELEVKDYVAKNPGVPPTKELLDKGNALQKRKEECPPVGNVFALQNKRWRRRGWSDNAYPGIGQGSVVPTDWCGFGCTLMGKKALDLCQFTGYGLQGTEDLYIVWKRWHQAGIKIGALMHCPSAHVVRRTDGLYTIFRPEFEVEDADCVGHIRVRNEPFYSMTAGEQYDPQNDGMFPPPKPEEKKA